MNKIGSNIYGKYSYKILTSSDALIFNRTKVFNGTIRDLQDGHICLSENLMQCKGILYKQFPNQSTVIFKFDNSKLGNLSTKMSKTGDVFLKCTAPLRLEHVIDSKDIYHDINDIISHWKQINNLENIFNDQDAKSKYYSDNIKEYAIKY